MMRELSGKYAPYYPANIFCESLKFLTQTYKFLKISAIYSRVCKKHAILMLVYVASCGFTSSVNPRIGTAAPQNPPVAPPRQKPRTPRNRASNASNSSSVLLMANRRPSARPFSRAQRTLVSIGKCKECVNV